jgi:hypothetical protein
MEHPQSIYVVSTEVRNEGAKYTDAFYVATRFCLIQRDAEHSALRISAEIRYIKPVNSLIKCKMVLYSYFIRSQIRTFE